MNDCIFCEIVLGEIPSDKVYEDDHVIAFMDIKPVAKGHVLVAPKAHYDDLLSSPDATLSDVTIKVKRIAAALMKAVNAQGINISTNNGAAAGQVIFHLHYHLIPRFANDDLKPWPHHDSEPKTRSEIAEAIRKNL